MLDISVTIKRKDGSQETYPVYPDSQVGFERWAKCSISQAFDPATKPKNEHLYYLAYLAEKNAGKVVKIFDEWIKDLAGVGTEQDPGN